MNDTVIGGGGGGGVLSEFVDPNLKTIDQRGKSILFWKALFTGSPKSSKSVIGFTREKLLRQKPEI